MGIAPGGEPSSPQRRHRCSASWARSAVTALSSPHENPAGPKSTVEMILASPRGGEPARRGLFLATASTEPKWTGVSGQTCPPLPCKGPGARTVRRSKGRQEKVAKHVVAERCPFFPTPHAGRSPPRGASIPLPGRWAGPVAVWGPPPSAVILQCPPHHATPSGPPGASRIKHTPLTPSGGPPCPHHPPPATPLPLPAPGPLHTLSSA